MPCVDALARPLWAAGGGEQALAALQGQLRQRLARLAGWLAGQGVALPAPACGAARLEAIECWLATRPLGAGAPGLPDLPARFYAARWLAEDAPRHTLLTDLGLLLGEAVCACRPGLAWGVDRFDAHAADGDPRFGRVVVLDPRQPAAARDPLVYDAIDAALMACQAQASDDPDAASPLAEGLHFLRWMPQP